MRKGASCVIVGGGVTGLSAAWWMARSGMDVLVLEKGIVGWEASGRNGGGTTHHHSPLFVEEQRLWPQMDELLGYPTEFRPKRIRLATNEEQLERFGQGVRNARHQGFRADYLDAKQMRELVPLAGDTTIGGVFYDFGGHANPQRTAQAYAWALQDKGGRIVQHCVVEGFRTASGKVSSVITQQGEFACDHLVLAAGPQTRKLAQELGVDVPIVSAKAEMIVTEPLPLMPIGGVDGNGLYGRQTLRGNLAYGGGPHEWLDDDVVAIPRNPSPVLRGIAARLAEMLPKAAHARVLRSWAGVIENTPDGRAIIDKMPTVENAIVATMSSVGFGLSPASGRAIRDLIIDEACGFADLTSLRLSRFSNLDPDWRLRMGWLPPAHAQVA